MAATAGRVWFFSSSDGSLISANKKETRTFKIQFLFSFVPGVTCEGRKYRGLRVKWGITGASFRIFVVIIGWKTKKLHKNAWIQKLLSMWQWDKSLGLQKNKKKTRSNWRDNPTFVFSPWWFHHRVYMSHHSLSSWLDTEALGERCNWNFTENLLFGVFILKAAYGKEGESSSPLICHSISATLWF